MLKQRNNGTWVIETGADLDKAMQLIEDREDMIAEAERIMEEKYEYLTFKEEHKALLDAVRDFMDRMDIASIPRPDRGYKLTLRKDWTSRWNPERLKNLVPKSVWLRITTQVVDPDKIDDLVRKGELDRQTIAPAFEQTKKKPYIRRYGLKDEEAAEREEESFEAALNG
jgi:hypothetical protein